MTQSSILLIGATGRTGRFVLSELLRRGYSKITIILRNDTVKEAFTSLPITTVIGDATSEPLMKDLLPKTDIVINCMASDNVLRPNEIEVTKLVTKYLPKGHLYLTISSIGVAESFKNLTIAAKLFFKTVMGSVMKQKGEIEKSVKDSGLKYVIVRPGGLLDEEKTDKVAVVKEAPSNVSGTIVRSKLATIMLDLMENPESHNKIWECAEIA
ncbi:MAG: SDR family oxidoreductase [Candidatus Dojkabacteria bacterium]|nr:MAG: SDR family oxidoreductase [Candidatus Dojkabacteria bacterium]